MQAHHEVVVIVSLHTLTLALALALALPLSLPSSLPSSLPPPPLPSSLSLSLSLSSVDSTAASSHHIGFCDAWLRPSTTVLFATGSTITAPYGLPPFSFACFARSVRFVNQRGQAPPALQPERSRWPNR